MNLSMPSLRLAGAALAAAPAPLPVVDTGGWKLQLQRARIELSRGAVPAPPTGARVPEPERPQLESCGVPLACGHPAVVDTPPPASARTASGPPGPSPRGSVREAERVPLRVHLQPEAGHELKVWLGIDGDAALVAQRATAAVAGLRRSLQSTGARIGAVVCNGVPVGLGAPSAASQPLRASMAPTFPKESSWPSVR